MARIELNTIEQNVSLGREQLADAKGGWFFYYNVFNPYQNLFGWNMQNSWIARGNAFDNQHNNFISFLRS
ncbi:MAG: hypothetical protein AAF648_10555 [Pseudomonadota bacterium]